MGRGTRAGKGIAKANGKATGRKAMKKVSNDTAITKARSKSSSSSAPVGSAVSRRLVPIVEIIEDSNSKNCNGSLHDFMEFYSPPQIAPKCRALGLNAEHSLDKTTSGHDFSQHNDRVRGFKLINELAPMLVMASPPCTMFSELQRLWNLKKRTVIMTNTHELAAVLRGKCCDGSHLHTVCSGSEGGVKLSTWCQVYPPQLCNAIAKAALRASR